MKYTNTQQIEKGLKYATTDPADDRVVLNSSSDMFINNKTGQLYGRGYAGMTVTVADQNYETYVCINDGPYKGNGQNITAANLATYWKRGDQTLYNYVHTEVDDYICTPHIKVNSEWISCTSTLSTTGIKGIDYVFNASIDNNTLKVNNNILSGWKFQLDKLSTPVSDANYAEYQLQYWQPGATSWANDPTKIEIPKLQVLKSVRLCVAVPDTTQMGGYKVATVKIGSQNVEVYRDDSRITESIWQQAAEDAEAQGGGVFLRIEWDNDQQQPPTAITYINVGDIITIDIDPLRERLDSLEGRGLVWDSSINSLERRARVVDISVNELETSVYSYLPPVINNINSSISALKNEDASIVNYINTVIGEGSSGISQQIANINSSIYDVSNRVASNYSTLSSSIGQTYTSLNNVITNEVTTAIARVDVKLDDVSVRVKNNYETLTTSISKFDVSIQRMDSSLLQMMNIIYENNQLFAASWAMFK